MKVLYIAGMGRSGSTLLARALGQLPQVIDVGELRFLWRTASQPNYLCGCRALFAECDFWQEVCRQTFDIPYTPQQAALYFAQQRQVDRVRYLPAVYLRRWFPQRQQKLESYLQLLNRLYQAIQNVSGANLIVDSSKDPSTLFLLTQLPEIELHVLHLVRDSRGVAYSWTKKKPNPDQKGKEAFMTQENPLATAGRWLLWNGALSSFFAYRQPQSYHFMRYEDFVADPPGQFQKLVRHLGLAIDSSSLWHNQQLQSYQLTHTISGNPIRFQQGAVKISLDNAWQVNKSFAGNRRWVTAITFPLLAAYGYFSPKVPASA